MGALVSAGWAGPTRLLLLGSALALPGSAAAILAFDALAAPDAAVLVMSGGALQFAIGLAVAGWLGRGRP